MAGVTSKSNSPYGWLLRIALTEKVTIDDTAVDAGNTGQTHILRAGLVMGKITASGKMAHYAPGASDGTETAYGILLSDVDTKDGDPGATAADMPGLLLIAGEVHDAANNCLLWDSAAAADFLKGGGSPGIIVNQPA